MSDKYTSIPIHRPRVRTTKTFLLVWLHNSTDTVNNNDYQNIIIELQQAVSGVHRFTDADEMVDFITDVAEEPIVLILSEVFVQTMISVAHEIPQVECVYILNENNVQCEQWSNKWRKMKGIYSDIKSIGEALIETSKIYNQDAISISFICACEEASDKNLNQLESSFMYTKIITEILFTIDFDRQHIEEFFAYCDGISTVRPRDIEMLRNEYHLHSPIWWYTHPCGLHNLLNYAIRVMDAEVMIRIGFFMRDLHQNITHLHSQQYPNYNRSSSFVVYRGQGLARADFEKLIKSKGGLLSFNSFLSTRDYINAIEFYEKSIEINRKLLPRTHLDLAASYRNLGIVYDKMAKHSINHPLKEKPIETIIAFNDLPFSTSDSDSNNDLISDSMDDYSKAVLSFENALIVLQQTFPPDDLILVTFYELYGTVYEKLGDYHKALSLHKRALEIKQKHLPSNHPSLATSYANHGTAYEQMGDIPTARSFYRRALDIGQRSLPSNHPDLRRFREMVGND
ncbi:unnamed protein product [Adineta steineri]|uniref:RGS domain-containing protein n=1 Tax=Adineta steineri TaxID=433720 RepID=A0A813SJ74_9BILA|nr:unnamed protein product [Adineta steineri]CAF1334461.1 unnamed protein product [Adineta steineri]